MAASSHALVIDRARHQRSAERWHMHVTLAAPCLDDPRRVHDGRDLVRDRLQLTSIAANRAPPPPSPSQIHAHVTRTPDYRRQLRSAQARIAMIAAARAHARESACAPIKRIKWLSKYSRFNNQSTRDCDRWPLAAGR